MHHSLTCMLAGIYWRGTKNGLPEAQKGPDQAETLCTLSLLSCQHYTILYTCVQQGHAFNQAHLMLAGIYWRGHHFGLLEALTASDQAEILHIIGPHMGPHNAMTLALISHAHAH